MKQGGFLQRKTPLRSSGFKPRECLPYVRPECDRSAPLQKLTRVPNYGAPANDPCISVPKVKPFKSEAYRRAVAMLPCMFCGIAGRSQAAHPNTGKGTGTKTDDRLCFPLCADGPGRQGCHPRFDQHALFDKQERRQKEVEWGQLTREKLKKLGLWPRNVQELE